MSQLRFLVIDDEADILKLIGSYLSGQGHEVLTAQDGEEGLRLFREQEPDLVILDVSMPKLDGFGVLRKIRDESETPVVMLTARTTNMDTVQGLYSGADDYVHKPFDLTVLDARIKAVLRRSEVDEHELPEVIEIGGLVIEDSGKHVTRDGIEIKLTPKEYDLLRYLASEPGRVFSHDEIIDAVWKGKSMVVSMDVIKYVNLLRNKLERDPKKPQYVKTVRGFGYKLDIEED